MVSQIAGGKFRHGQGVSMSIPVHGEEDPEDGHGMKDRRRRRRRVTVHVWNFLRSRRGMKLVLLACFLLLVFGIFAHSAMQGRIPEQSKLKATKAAKESNLGKLDMPTRMVAGVRQPCLQLLPEGKLEQLQLPPTTPSSIKDLQYLTSGRTFAGEPTASQRSASFEVHDSMQVHCGWCSGSGFDIDAVDQAFMNTCRVVVITCTFGGGDDLYQPIGLLNATAAKVFYVAFWDEVTRKMQEDAGKTLGADRMIGLWRIILVRNLPFADQRKNGKIPKMLGHRLFPNARFSIWTDSKSQFRRDPMGALEALLWKPGADFAISEHGARSCVYKEGVAIVQKHKAAPEEVAIQLDVYRAEGMPENVRIDGHKALGEASVIVREHTPATNLFMCVWFNEVMRFTARDQLSFPYVLYRLRALLHLNMFPVCTRKALVNSLGHARKAPPLLADG